MRCSWSPPPSLFQEGHPLVGSWHGSWGSDEKNRSDFTHAQYGSVELEVYKIVIRIHFIMEACNWLELKIQLQDFVQVTQTPRIYFQFDHNSSEGSGLAVSAQFLSVLWVCVDCKAAIQDVHLKE